MPLDDFKPDDDSESLTYQAGQEYPVEYTGCFVTPVYHITPVTPTHYFQEHEEYRQATRAWIEEKDPLMTPEMFELFFHKRSKSVFSGESRLRSQVVIKDTNVHGEWMLDRDEVELGFEFLAAVYYNDTHYTDRDKEYRRPESLMQFDLERQNKQVAGLLEDTEYEISSYTLVPHKAGTKPLNPEYQRY